MGVAKAERAELCDLFLDVGPEAPTLCTGWRTRDLAAHLVIRERRPDALPGILGGPLAPHTERVQGSYAARSWPELVGLVRHGPPPYWPTAVARVDELVNSAEFFVHHEDVRRAGPGWEPRPRQPRRDAALWAAMSKVGRLLLRRSPVGVVLRTPDGLETTARRGPNQVIITGPPGELLLFAFGRDQVRLDFDGEPASVAVLRGASRGV